jgi:glutamate synthase (NADPH/NADH) large chain
MIAVDMEEQRCSTTRRSRTLAAARPFGEWVGKITDLAEARRRHRNRPVRGMDAAPPAGRRRLFHRGAGEILAPMAEDGKETLASMGDDTPLRCCRASIAR